MLYAHLKSRVRVLTGGVLAAAIFSSSVWAAVPEVPSGNITLGGTSSSSSFYAFHAAVSKVLSEHTEGNVRMQVMETGASVDNLNLMMQGRADIGHITSFALTQSYRGAGPWENHGPDRDIRQVIAFSLSPQAMVVRADSGVESLDDLDGKPFAAGLQGSATAIEVRAAMKAIGVQPEYKSVSLEDALSQVQDGRIIGFAKSSASPSTPDASLMRLMTSVDVNILSFSDQQLETIKQEVPLLLPFTIPANTYQGQSEPIKVIGHTSGYGAPSSLDPDVVYHLWEAMTKRQEALADVNEKWKNADFVKMTLEDAPPVPLHLGTYRWMRDNGVDVPERLIPPEAKQ